MSEIKNYKLTKTTPNNVLFLLSPVSNPALSRKILLTDKHPVQILPEDWALGIFADDKCYALYKKKYITFDDNEGIVKTAYEKGVFFDDVLDFKPASDNRVSKILKTLENGNREQILKTIKEEGEAIVRDVATTNAANLKQGVVNMLESILKVQLIIDNDTAE